jgi:hypothetical protein
MSVTAAHRRARLASQRGNIGLYMLFSLAASIASGYGVYVLIRDRPRSAVDDTREVEPAPARPEPVATPTPATPTPAEPVAEATPVDIAERDAVAPADLDDPPKDTVLYGRPGVDGELDVASVEHTVKRYSVRYERCFRKTHERYRMRPGGLRLTVVIGSDGSVIQASYRTTVEDELATCVMDVVKKLKFDKPTDGAIAKVVYPMVFWPANGGDAGDPYPSPPRSAPAGSDDL